MNQSKIQDFLIKNASTLKGVGKKTKKLLKKKKIEKVSDLLWNFPQGYTDRSNLQKLDKLEIGKITTNNNLQTTDAPLGQFVTEKFPVFSVFPTPSINLDTWKLTINADSNLIREYKWNEIIKLTEDELIRLSEKFYNDTYLMDQNACSSPHLIVWLGKKKQKAKNQFWESLDAYVRKNYNLPSVSAVDKYNRFCQNAIDINIPFELIQHGNHIYRIVLDKLPEDIHSFRGNCGYFFEYDAKKLSEIIHIISNKYQTLTYFGLDKLSLKNFVIDNKLNGIDRIVPIGQALDISLTWDGFGIIESLSRIVDYN